MAASPPSSPRKPHLVGLAVALVAVALGSALAVKALSPAELPDRAAAAARPEPKPHFDHTPLFDAPFDSPQAVTRRCLECHEDAREVMQTSHWLWLGDEIALPGRGGPKMRIGKKNLLNNFCLFAPGNERACTKCHIGYGWKDESFDFENAENVDCLVCHERSGAYAKGDYGLPTAESDLLAAARSVGRPERQNCIGCHAYGGGGHAVKHGDLDTSLVQATESADVHMGRYGLQCIDCHTSRNHHLRGRAFSVSVEDSNSVGCTDCHTRPEHRDPRLNAHLDAVACQTCHIPTYARKAPTKMVWDWSKAGDVNRPDDEHHYLKIKGEFVYAQDLVPEYRWFDGTMDRYLLGDRIDPEKVTSVNRPRGARGDSKAKIWPFKVHRALQPYDAENRILLNPVTAGPEGFWTRFDWDDALKRGAAISKLNYSGHYGFARTEMFWALSHTVLPKEEALRCDDCHGAGGRLDWRALGYHGDPMATGARQ